MRARRLVLASALAAASVGALPSTAVGAPPGLSHRVAEIAALYGVPARTATVVETVAARRPQGLRDVVLPPRRRVVVVALDGPAHRVQTPAGGRRGIVQALVDARTGRVMAAAVERRRPALAELERAQRLRLPSLGAGAPPAVTGLGFDAALEALRAAGYRVAVSRFPRLQAGVTAEPSGLATPGVAGAFPIGRRTVRLTLVPRLGAVGSPVVPVNRPPAIRVPGFVGMTYAAARMAGVPGLYVRFGTVAALRPASSVRGLDAFVVTSQRPAAGTLVPAYGVPISNGVDLGPSVVTLTLGVRGPGAG